MKCRTGATVGEKVGAHQPLSENPLANPRRTTDRFKTNFRPVQCLKISKTPPFSSPPQPLTPPMWSRPDGLQVPRKSAPQSKKRLPARPRRARKPQSRRARPGSPPTPGKKARSGSPAIRRSAYALTSSRKNDPASHARASPRTIGWMPGASCSKKRSNARNKPRRASPPPCGRRERRRRFPTPQTPSLALPTGSGYNAAWIPGTHSFTFSTRRAIVNGFAKKPRTPASWRSSRARSSSPRPETNNSGGNARGGRAFS